MISPNNSSRSSYSQTRYLWAGLRTTKEEFIRNKGKLIMLMYKNFV